MELKKYFKNDEDEEKAVSPVIGVVLMVAVTVVLAAIIGSTVFGFGQTSEQGPRAGIQFSEIGGGDVEGVIDSAPRLDSVTVSVEPNSTSGSVSDLEISPAEPGDAFYYCGGQVGDTIIVTGSFQGVEQVLQSYELRTGSGGVGTLQEGKC